MHPPLSRQATPLPLCTPSGQALLFVYHPFGDCVAPSRCIPVGAGETVLPEGSSHKMSSVGSNELEFMALWLTATPRLAARI